jgi:tRNA modification GTPase
VASNLDCREKVDCRVTLLTAPSRGAIATLSVEGRDAGSLVASHFRSPANNHRHRFPIGRILFGHWRNLRGTEEEIVLCRRSETSFEVNCHGGAAASEAIIGSLVADGATRPLPAEWLAQRVVDPVRQAAWLALCQARTPRTAGILLDQFRGALTRELLEVRHLLHGHASKNVAAIAPRLDRLLDLSGVGLHLTMPWRVVVAGPPNVGKSSLINAILGYPRTIVFDQPGTTRDVLATTTALDGWVVELLDTAGLRDTTDPVEAEGVCRARLQIADADLVVWVEDSLTRTGPAAARPSLSHPVIEVMNKGDLQPRTQLPAQRLVTSAITGCGIDRLVNAIVEQLVPRSPYVGEAVLFTVEQVDRLRQVRYAVASDQWPLAIQILESVLGEAT